MHLIVFDIDGTLLDSSAVDDACFVQAVRDVFGIEGISEDWATYEHCTDVAIASQLLRDRLGRSCAGADLDCFRQRFVELLTAAHAADESVFREVPGARSLVAELATNGTAVSLATGGFEQSARLKLRLARIECDGIPAAFSEDGPSREQIVTASIARAQHHHASCAFERVVSVGDGVWDVRTAASLSIPFIGIGDGERAVRLRQAGARTILADYADRSRFAEAIETATVPERNVP